MISESFFDIFCLENNVSEFVHKLYSILSKNQYEQVIQWTISNEILIKDIKSLQKSVLKHYFRHSKMESFIRQLNMYGFHKINKANKQKNFIYFKHENFQKDNIEALKLIKRKKKGEVYVDSKANKSENTQSRKDLLQERRKIVKEKIQMMRNIIEKVKKNNNHLNLFEFQRFSEITRVILNQDKEEQSPLFKKSEYPHEFKEKSIQNIFFQQEQEPYKFQSLLSIYDYGKY